MNQFRLLMSVGILLFSISLYGQDIHFSLFHMSPLTLNPAQTGAFEGTARIGGIYRDQWGSFLNNPNNPNQFKTTVFYVDAPVIRGFGKYDWVGVGLTNISDIAGTFDLKESGQLFSVSYHRALSKRSTDHVITLGIQGGRLTRTFDFYRGFLFGNDLRDDFNATPSARPTDRGLQNTASDSAPESKFFDISAGLMLRSVLSDRARLEVGVAGIHLTGAESNLLNENIRDTTIDNTVFQADDVYKKPFLLNFHGRVRYQLTDDWTLTPGFVARTIEGSSPEIILQTWAGRRINDEFDLNFGTAYRFGDAAQVLIGVDYLKDLKIALSYDINLSSLNTVSNYQGGFELSAAYIIKLYKQPDSTPTILCPKF